MKIYSVNDPEFKPYGKVLGYNTSCLVKALDEATPLPDGVEYVMSCADLEYTKAFGQLQNNAYGGMPAITTGDRPYRRAHGQGKHHDPQ